MHKLLVAIPCLNEAAGLADVIRRVPRQIDGIDSVTVLVIDDGSSDGSADVASCCGAEVLRHEYNRGVGAAFHSAHDYALEGRFAYMVNIDGDGQFDPADIPVLLKPILEGRAQMVTGSRFKNKDLVPDMPQIKLLGNRVMSFLVRRLSRSGFNDVSCGFRAYSREALLHLNLHGKFTYTQETFLNLAAQGVHIEEVPIRVRYFKDRQSRVARSIPRYAINTSLIILRTYRDYFPLRFFLGAAAIFLIPGIVFGAIFWLHYLESGRFTGYLYAGLLSGFCLLVSLLLALAGLVADMLDRIRIDQERILYLMKQSRGSLDHRDASVMAAPDANAERPKAHVEIGGRLTRELPLDPDLPRRLR